jgi:hypothetical protein
MPAQRQRMHAIAQSVARCWQAATSGTTMAAPLTPVPAMNPRRRLLALGLAAASLPAFASTSEVRGSGRTTSERRSVSGFERLTIAGPFEVELRQGSIEGVELTGDDDLLPLVDTVVEGRDGSRSLRIAPRRDVELRPSQPIRIRIDLVRLGSISLAGGPRLQSSGLRTSRLSLAIGGSGDVALAALEAERLAVDIGGSGRITVDGRCPEAALSIAGSGRVTLVNLAAEDVSVSIAGSGTAEVRAERRLKVSIAGSGQVRHSGAAVPEVSIVGNGDVQRL